MTTVDAQHLTEHSGLAFFLMSAFIYRKKEYAAVVIITNAATLMWRAIRLDGAIPNTITIYFLYIYAYSIFYFLIYSKIGIPPSCRYKELTQNENTLIELLATGNTQKEAGSELGIPLSTVSNMIKVIRKKTGYTTLNEVLYNAKDSTKSSIWRIANNRV